MSSIIPLAHTLALLPGVRDDEIVLVWETSAGQLVSAVTDVRAISDAEEAR